MYINKNLLKNISIGISLVMSSSLVGCGNAIDYYNIINTNTSTKEYRGPDGLIYDNEDEYLMISNFDRTIEDLEEEASLNNKELNVINYYSSYNFDSTINDIKYTSDYTSDGKDIYSYSVNSCDPNIVSVLSDTKYVCVDECHGAWKISGEEIKDNNGDIYLVYPDYEVVEYDGITYVAPIKESAKKNLEGIQANISYNKTKKFN